MTQDKARKAATRQRMAATGEPYSVARRAVEDANGPSDWPRRRHGHYRAHRPPVPPRPPRPSVPPRVHHARPGRDRDPADRLQDGFEQLLQRFNLVRDRADELIRLAERIFGPGHAESEPARPPSAQA